METRLGTNVGLGSLSDMSSSRKIGTPVPLTPVASVGLADLDIGASYSGAQEYYNEINSKMIAETIKILDNFQTEVLDVVKKGWIGASYALFETDMQNRVAEIKTQLTKEGEALAKRLVSIAEAYHSIDAGLYGNVGKTATYKN